jgi:hypothetical protein
LEYKGILTDTSARRFIFVISAISSESSFVEFVIPSAENYFSWFYVGIDDNPELDAR